MTAEEVTAAGVAQFDTSAGLNRLAQKERRGEGVSRIFFLSCYLTVTRANKKEVAYVKSYVN